MAGYARNPEDRSIVQAQLTYLVNTGRKPVVYPSEAGGRSEQQTGKYADHRVTIRNGRENRDPFSLDREGFVLMESETRVRDFYSDRELRAVYDTEIEQLVKSVTGAVKVTVFDHTRRAAAAATRGQKKVREPVRTVHSDYTERSATRRIRDFLPSSEAEQRLERRFAIVNVWRPIIGPVQTSPLAVCDAQSIAARDLVVTERRARDRVGELYHISFNPDHRWYYFPDMQSNEALVIKTYDSAVDGTARFTAHTSFDDPASPPDAMSRESIESRCFVFF